MDQAEETVPVAEEQPVPVSEVGMLLFCFLSFCYKTKFTQANLEI